MPGARAFQDYRQLFRRALTELPQVGVFIDSDRSRYLTCVQLLFIYQVIRTPADMPVTMAAFTVIQAAVNNFTSRLTELFRWGEDIAQTITQLRDIYELGNIDNQIPDGTEPFPENVQDTAANGVTVEFKSVIQASSNFTSGLTGLFAGTSRLSTQNRTRGRCVKYPSGSTAVRSASSSAPTAVARVVS